MVRLYRTKGRNKFIKKFKNWHLAMRWVRHWMPHILDDDKIMNYVLLFTRGAKLTFKEK